MKMDINLLPYYFLTLEYMNHNSIGRYALASNLDITRAKARKILDQLKAMGFVATHGKSSGRKGTSITENGRKVINKLHGKLRICMSNEFTFPEEYRLDKFHSIVSITDKNIDLNSISGVFERDTAIRYGATGAIIVVNEKGGWIFPNDRSPSKIISSHDDEESRGLIISFGESQGKANVSATETAFTIIDTEEIMDIFYEFL